MYLCVSYDSHKELRLFLDFQVFKFVSKYFVLFLGLEVDRSKAYTH